LYWGYFPLFDRSARRPDRWVDTSHSLEVFQGRMIA
jgi:hypothetical protein